MVTPLVHSPFLFGQQYLQRLFEGDDVCFALEGELLAIPTDALDNPVVLAALASELRWGAAGDGVSERGEEGQASVLWHHALRHELALESWQGPAQNTPRHQLPPLTEAALLVHVLGLEAAGAVPVLALAVDHLLMNTLAPAAQVIDVQGQCHEPMAGYLVNAIARALRPWSFEAPPLAIDQRMVLLFLLADLATSKARKLLHEEKKHAHRHASPGLLCHAVNQALRRWQRRNVSLSPRQRIVRAAATFRYLNQCRRQGEPSRLDIEVVADLQRTAL